jgi:hypothetical protein
MQVGTLNPVELIHSIVVTIRAGLVDICLDI